MLICQTCAVEHEEGAGACAICADDRQWVPAEGQQWTTLQELAQAGHRCRLAEVEPGLFGLTVEPKVGIGQQSLLLTTPKGNVLWDPVGYIDDGAVRQIRELGDVVAIVASHPHMFGVQVEWSRALGDAPILVAEADQEWVARQDSRIETWSGSRDLLPGVQLRQVGGHFPGSAVIHWRAAADGPGVMLAGDTFQANPDRTSVTFMRSFPNRIPLSAGVVERIAGTLAEYEFDRVYDNLGRPILADADRIVQTSAQRYARWVRGDFDHLT